MAGAFVRAASTATGTISSPTTLSIDTTLSAGSGNRKLLVGVVINVSNGGTDPAETVTFNGNASNLINQGLIGGGAAPDLYRKYLYWDEADLPASGSANVSVSFTTTDVQSIAIVAVLLEDAAQGAVDDWAHATNLSPSVTPTSQPGVCVDMCGVLEDVTITKGTSFTSCAVDTDSGGTGTTETSIHASYYAYSSTATISDSLSQSGSGNDSVVRVAVAESVPGGPTNTPVSQIMSL